MLVVKQTIDAGHTGFQKNEEAPESQQTNGRTSKQIKADEAGRKLISGNLNSRQIPQRETQGHIGNTAMDQTKTI